jgi:hypothetical protein
MKLKLEQKNYLKEIHSRKRRKKIKKTFQACNNERQLEDYKLFVEDLFNVITNPLFMELVKR